MQQRESWTVGEYDSSIIAMFSCECVCVCVRACVRVFERERACMCACVRELVCMCVHAFMGRV